MFRTNLGLSSRVTTAFIRHLILAILCRKTGWIVNPFSITDSHLHRIASTNCCIHTVVPSDDKPRFVRNI